jgi:hypothetical protein
MKIPRIFTNHDWHLTLDSAPDSILYFSLAMGTELRIGEVARRSGVSIDALRYDERLRLLPRTRRSSGGFRLFTSEHVVRIQFIKQSQDLGFSLEEIKGLLATGGAEECRKVCSES